MKYFVFILYKTIYVYMLYVNICTIAKELHAKGKLAFESIDLEAFLFEPRKKIFKLLCGLISLKIISK